MAPTSSEEEEVESWGGDRHSSRDCSGFPSSWYLRQTGASALQPLLQNKLVPLGTNFRSLIVTLFTRLSKTFFFFFKWFGLIKVTSLASEERLSFFFNLWNSVARKEGQITRLFFYFEDTPAWPLSKSLIGLFSVILSRLLLVCRIDLSGSEFAPLHKSSKSDYLNGKYLTLAPLWQEVVPYSKVVYTKLQSARMIHSGEVSHRWDKRASASSSFFVLMLFFFFFFHYAQTVSHCLMCIPKDL